MNEVTRILSELRPDDPTAAGQLLPLVYEELRKLAAQRVAGERPGHSLGATALVHEAYLRLVNVEQAQHWNGRGHFFAAAAEAMRRILVERARQRCALKRGGGQRQLDLEQADLSDGGERSDELLALDEALSEFERHDPQAAQLVKLRYFAGLSHQEAAQALGVGRRAADRMWALAKAWLLHRMGGS